MLRVRSLAAIAGLLFAVLVAFAPMASAQTDDPAYPIVSTPPSVLGTDFQKGDPPADPLADPPADPPQVLGAAQQTLPVTGSDVLGLSVLGLIAIGGGFALVRYQRSAANRV